MRTHLTSLDRFWSHVDPCRTDGCAVWLGHLNAKGYDGFSRWYADRPSTLKE